MVSVGGFESSCSVLIKTILLLLFIIMCLGKYFPTSEVGVDPKTIKDHDLVPQGIN